MKILSFKYKAHKLVNYLFYLIIFVLGFFIGFTTNKINLNEIVNKVLMIDHVSALEIEYYDDSSYYTEIVNKLGSPGITEEYAYKLFEKVNNDKNLNLNFNDFSDIVIADRTTNLYQTNYYFCTSLSGSIKNPTCTGQFLYINLSTYSDNSSVGYQKNYNSTFYNDRSSAYKYYSSNSNLTGTYKDLDFSSYRVKLDVQLNTWNGYGYDYYTNQVGIIDMKQDTQIVSSHTCPNDGPFVNGYLGDTKDQCFWSYDNQLSDYLVFYYNARNYDSENVEWSNITFIKDHIYSLSFTLYGLVDSETLSSIQFSLEGNLTQEIYSTSFTKILRDSLEERTYITFAITPTEDIEMDHFFLKFKANGSYAQTVGANRLWSYKDYTGMSLEEIQIEQTDKILQDNKNLKDLITNPNINKTKTNDFWNSFEHKDFGLTQIITLPINTIKKISNGTCTPYNIQILNQTIQMPCGDTLFWNREDVQSFKIFWNLFWGGLICYGIGGLIIKDVQKAINPNNDKLEVIDL